MKCFVLQCTFNFNFSPLPIKDSFRELWNQIMSPRSGLDLQSHRFRLRTYQNCFVGSELVDWFLTHEKASTRYSPTVINNSKLYTFRLLKPFNTQDLILILPFSCYTFPYKLGTRICFLDQDGNSYLIGLNILIACLLGNVWVL